MAQEIVHLVSPDGTDIEPVSARRTAGLGRRDRARLAEYVRFVADALGLRDWTIEIDWSTPADEDSDASIEVIYGRKVAVLHLGVDFAIRTAHTQRYLICHELTHCHLGPLDEFAKRSAEAVFGVSGNAVFVVGYDQHSETVTDSIAAAFAELVPLPELSAQSPTRAAVAARGGKSRKGAKGTQKAAKHKNSKGKGKGKGKGDQRGE